MEKDICCRVSAVEIETIQNVKRNLKTISAQGGVVCFQKDHVLFYEGHASCGFYILRKGEIELFRTDMQGQKVVLPSGDHSVFGLFHLITNIPYCATARAQTDAETLFVPKSAVLEFLEHH